MEITTPHIAPWIFWALLFVVSTTLTEIVRMLAAKAGFTSKPSGDRWNRRVVSLGGGIAILLTVLAACLWIQGSIPLDFGLPILVVFILGLIDDIWGVPPAGKLIVQAIAGAYLASRGVRLPISNETLSIALTVVWVLAISNAVNLIDNMDGVASGVVAILAAGLAFLFFRQGNPQFMLLSGAISASCFGFLVHNFHPARIFMGDSGSLALGFALAALVTQIKVASDLSESVAIIAAVAILSPALFDTILVMISRSQANRPLMSGGRDHTSHRLVALGLTEKRTVLILYAFAMIGVGICHLVSQASPLSVLIITILYMGTLALVAVFLLDMVVYPNAPVMKLRNQSLHRSLPQPLLYSIEITLDIFIICLAWTTAHLLRFHDEDIVLYAPLTLAPIIPFLLMAKLSSFLGFRLYRGLWQTVFIKDVYRIFKAASLGTLITVLGLALVTRLQDVSRTVIVLDWLLTFIGLLGVRTAISGFRRWSRKLASSPYRAALLGPSSLMNATEEATLLEPGIKFHGVIYTDTTEPHGEKILGSATRLNELLENNQIDMILVATPDFNAKLSSLAARGFLIRQVTVQLG